VQKEMLTGSLLNYTSSSAPNICTQCEQHRQKGPAFFKIGALKSKKIDVGPTLERNMWATLRILSTISRHSPHLKGTYPIGIKEKERKVLQPYPFLTFNHLVSVFQLIFSKTNYNNFSQIINNIMLRK